MSTKKTYRNSLRSKRMIKDGVVSLLKKGKDFYSITVSDVCNEAGLNRGTFYNHYANISEVANGIEDEMMEELSAAWNDSKLTNGNIDNFILTVTGKLKEKEQAFKHVVNYIPDYFFTNLENKFLKEIQNDFLLPGITLSKAKAVISILSDGIVSLYLDYFQGKTDLSLDEIGKYSIEVVDKMLGKKEEVK
ncbi:MAG: TetR/AcrR family transcriptional regulator [Bacilli bacterium]|jgi:AcrR family transcriptional regulator|nr:TetR/AcrR family transcriptional regulator [Bacilli bacterium]